MTEAEARAWIEARHGPEALHRCARYVAALLDENTRQNLISRASEPAVWVRHILDSAQLARFAPDAATWLDIGSGPGLPGVVLALLSDRPITLVEPRRRRVEFLEKVRRDLALDHVDIRPCEIEKLSPATFHAVTARAYAPLTQMLSSTIRLTARSTIWILPKGRGAERELAEARANWQGVFHVEQSLSDADARIIVATGVRAWR